MSIISLSTYTDMSGAATPSTGIIMGLDLDGTLKQKGTTGVVTEIGSGGGGSAGTSGSSGTSGYSGTSGIAGLTGPSGSDGGNSLRWIYGDSTVSGEFELSSPDFTQSNNVISINDSSQTGDTSSWLSSLSDYVTLFTGGAYLKISELSDPNIYGIYQVTVGSDQTSHWRFDCDMLSSHGTPTTGFEYSISWIIMGGNSGSSGTSGSSGSSGSSGTSGSTGTSGSSGSSGNSGVDGANTLRWELDNTVTATTSEIFDTNSEINTSVISSINVSKTSINGNADTWLSVIHTSVNTNPDSVYLQITRSNDPTTFGIYSLLTSVDAGTHYAFGVSPTGVISSNGVLEENRSYSIGFILQSASSGTSGSGTSGSSGSSGTSGSNGSSGTSGSSGSNGSSGTSGSNGSSGVSGEIYVEPTAISATSGTIVTPLASPSLRPEYYAIDTTSNSVSLTLSSTSVLADGKIVIFKDEAGNATANAIAIYPHLGEFIDGANLLEISVNYGSVTLIKNGVSWFVISKLI